MIPTLLPVENLNDDLRAACADARVDADTVRLYRFMEPHSDEGMFVPAGMSRPLHPRLTSRQHDDVDQNLELHRIAVQDGPVIPFTARFRHELEHCAQYEEHGLAIFTLTTAIDHALEVRYPEIRGVYDLRYLGPVEGDANGASSNFVRARFGLPLDFQPETGSDRLLLDPAAPPPQRAILVPRQACFAGVFADELQTVLGPDLIPEISALSDDAVETWNTARLDPEVRHHIEVAKREAPTLQAATDADSEDLIRIWDPAKQATSRAYERALAVNGIA